MLKIIGSRLNRSANSWCRDRVWAVVEGRSRYEAVPIGLWLVKMVDRRLGTRGFTAVRLDRGGLPTDGAVLGNDRAAAEADGKSVVWREDDVCQTLVGRGADRALAGEESRSGDESVLIDLNALMQMVYESAALDLAIDYGQQTTPGLSQDDFDWVQEIVVD
jgi:Protein of unknown function (DUF4058)